MQLVVTGVQAGVAAKVDHAAIVVPREAHRGSPPEPLQEVFPSQEDEAGQRKADKGIPGKSRPRR
jgi:hypothetical protein